jgi:N-acetylneuraminic acid mutarotase
LQVPLVESPTHGTSHILIDPAVYSAKKEITVRRLKKVSVLSLIIGFCSVNLSAQTWTERAPIPTMRWNPASVVIGNNIYVIGGQDDSGTAIGVVEAYNTETDTWVTLAEMPTERWGLMASVWHGKIYAIGGQGGSFPGTSTDAAEVYDPLTNSWSSVAALPTSRGWGGCATIGDTIYVFGGFISDGYQTSRAVDKYSPIANTWSSDPEMPILRDCFMSAAVGDRIYALGGWTEFEDNSRLVQEYDPQTKVWTEKAPMPTARSFTEATDMNDSIFVAGGRGGNEDAFESYDPATDTWTVWAPMIIQREGVAVAEANGKVYVTAGSARSGYPYYDENYEASNFSLPAEKEIGPRPSQYTVLQTRPNPLDSFATVTFHLPQSERVRLEVYDVSGMLVRTLMNDERNAGSHSLLWKGDDDNGQMVANGLYVCKLEAGNHGCSERLIVLR